MKIQEDICT